MKNGGKNKSVAFIFLFSVIKITFKYYGKKHQFAISSSKASCFVQLNIAGRKQMTPEARH